MEDHASTLKIYPQHTDLPKQQHVYPFIELSRFKGKLTGKVLCLTGASSGIGRVAALAFASTGASVACVARRKDRLDALVDEIKQKFGVPAVAISADVEDIKSAKHIVQATEQALGPIDILVSAAGYNHPQLFQHIDDFDEEFLKVVRTNFHAPAALTHAVLPSMLARKTGVLINVASDSAAHDAQAVSPYASAKAAMIKLYQTLRLELDDKITVFNMHPGAVHTDMVEDSFDRIGKIYGLDLWSWNIPFADAEVPANTLVALSADPRCKALNGRYINAEQDLEKVLEAVESGRVEKENLYWMKIDEV